MLSINAVKGFEYGSGFCGAKMKGSEHNDLYNSDGTTKQIFQVVFKVELATEWTFISSSF
jgi:chorismate synthase